ncbi:subtilisin family serine protease [Actinokineospora baliensis]|uniref:S8 family peptidase n=1 Tax=Actinokineospora baliensis TaxID=547056 RepID=UPI00195AD841|nr:S8 family peptidase [Actinokineospora baliensis]MBM7770411.1 subtilisin family serine protease [Actinokineospora baliensis]
MRMRFIATGLVLAVGLSTAVVASAGASSESAAGTYIVLFTDGTASVADTSGVAVRKRYNALGGFSADLSRSALDRLRRDPAVALVQENRVHRMEAAPAAAAAAPWHVDRVDQRNLPLNGTFTPYGTGAGVDVYVVDSGVRTTHSEFEGRATSVYNTVSDGNGNTDCAGHGTFVASHIAGKTYGVAKKAKIKAVRVLKCDNSGTTEDMADGMNWTALNAPAGSIVNISLQSSNGVTDSVLDAAAKKLVDRGMLPVLIAGNFNKGDCRNSPKDSRAIIMGATTKTDARNTGTNASSYGSCVTAFAPGANVTGAGKSSDTAVQSGWYGTSFAAPLASGALAIAKAGNPGLTLAQAKQLIIDRSTKGVLTGVGTGSPNRLLYVGS